MLDSEETIRRVKAARLLAGMTTLKDLADAIDERGMSKGTLAQRESVNGPDYGRRDLMVIAAATKIPLPFFLEPLDELTRRLGDIGTRAGVGELLGPGAFADTMSIEDAEQNLINGVKAGNPAATAAAERMAQALREAGQADQRDQAADRQAPGDTGRQAEGRGGVDG